MPLPAKLHFARSEVFANRRAGRNRLADTPTLRSTASLHRGVTKHSLVTSGKCPQADYRARFLKMWGPDAFHSQVSVAKEFAELRRERAL